jgi:hypothetical protein
MSMFGYSGAIPAGDARRGAAVRARQRSREDGATSGRVVVACSLLLLLVGATALVGARTTIESLLQSAAAARASLRTGQIVYTLPDGIYCRRVSFDNATAQISEGPMERCQNDVAGFRLRSKREFSWGKH